MGTLLWDKVLRKLPQCESFLWAVVLQELLQYGSFPQGTVLQENTVPAWVPNRVTSPARKPALCGLSTGCSFFQVISTCSSTESSMGSMSASLFLSLLFFLLLYLTDAAQCSLPFLKYVITEALPMLLIVSALGSVPHGSSFSCLLTDTRPLCYQNPDT